MVDMQTIMDEMRKTQELLKPKENNKEQKNKEQSQKQPEKQTQEETPTVSDDNSKDSDLELPELNIPPPLADENESSDDEISAQPIVKQKSTPLSKITAVLKNNKSKKITENNSTNQSNDPQLFNAIQELNANIAELLQLFKSTADEMKKEDPLAAKIDQVADQNDKIAQALLSVADMIKDLQSQNSVSNSSPMLAQEVPNNPNMPVYREPNYSFSQDKMQMPSFRPKFVATDTGVEMPLPKPPIDDYASYDGLQPLPEMRNSKMQSTQSNAPREELKPLEFNKPPLSLSDMKKKGLFS